MKRSLEEITQKTAEFYGVHINCMRDSGGNQDPRRVAIYLAHLSGYLVASMANCFKCDRAYVTRYCADGKMICPPALKRFVSGEVASTEDRIQILESRLDKLEKELSDSRSMLSLNIARDIARRVVERASN